MNEYRSRNTGNIMGEMEFRAAFPNVALPAVLDDRTLETCGYDVVLSAPPPEVDATQVALRDGARQDEKGDWVYSWRVEYLPDEVVAANAAYAAQLEREAAKAARATAVAAITVDVDGMTFDGDEISQGRMARAIIALEAAGVPGTEWTLTNNVIKTVTVAQLRMALVKAGLAQTALWSI